MRLVGDPNLSAALRVQWITDDQGDCDRIERIVRDALEGGVRAFQLREKAWSARQVAIACERLRPIVEAAGGVLLVNDRADVVAAGLAHGVQIGARSLPIDAVRKLLPAPAVLGYSAHDAAELETAARGGADFALLAPVFATTSKPGVDPLGVPLATELTARARLPVVWLGGIDADSIRRVPADRVAGCAVRSALCRGRDVVGVARRLVAHFG